MRSWSAIKGACCRRRTAARRGASWQARRACRFTASLIAAARPLGLPGAAASSCAAPRRLTPLRSRRFPASNANPNSNRPTTRSCPTSRAPSRPTTKNRRCSSALLLDLHLFRDEIDGDGFAVKLRVRLLRGRAEGEADVGLFLERAATDLTGHVGDVARELYVVERVCVNFVEACAGLHVEDGACAAGAFDFGEHAAYLLAVGACCEHGRRTFNRLRLRGR